MFRSYSQEQCNKSKYNKTKEEDKNKISSNDDNYYNIKQEVKKIKKEVREIKTMLKDIHKVLVNHKTVIESHYNESYEKD